MWLGPASRTPRAPVIYDRGDTAGRPDHIASSSGSTVRAGSPPSMESPRVANDANGGEVMRRELRITQAIGSAAGDPLIRRWRTASQSRRWARISIRPRLIPMGPQARGARLRSPQNIERCLVDDSAPRTTGVTAGQPAMAARRQHRGGWSRPRRRRLRTSAARAQTCGLHGLGFDSCNAPAIAPSAMARPPLPAPCISSAGN